MKPDFHTLDRRETAGIKHFEMNLWAIFKWVALAGSLWFAVTGLVTFQPYEILGYKALPPVGCPGQTFDLHLMREAQRPTLGWINEVSLKLWWQDIDNPETTLLAATPTDVFNGGYGLDNDALGILSIVPDRPGRWRVITVATIKGVSLLMPNESVVEHTTEQVYTVLPPEHPDCAGGAQ